MKRLIILASLALTGVMAFGQGYLVFGNRNTLLTPPLAARVFQADGTTALSGTGFQAQLYWGTANDANALSAVGTAVPFRTGTFAGYISSSTVTLPGTAAGQTVFVQMRAWDTAAGATYAAALASGAGYGFSNIIPVTLAASPTPPPDMVGLTGFNLIVPEPSTIALGLLGLGALVLRRRK